MGRYKQKSDSHGSLKDLQILVNRYPGLLNEKVNLSLSSNIAIKWLSPIDSDEYAEYRDDDFINKLGLQNLKRSLKEFWPSMGPQWDGLGCSDSKYFLIEAKANIPEIISPPCQAGDISMNKIMTSLYEVKEYLGVNNNIDWSSFFYQYTNRIAHLYFLHIVNEIDAYLLNIYFINDDSVKGPKSKEEWLGAIQLIKNYLGLANNKLSQRMLDIFIDTNNCK